MSTNHPFSKFVESSDYWAWETDCDLRMVYVSPNFETLTGWPVQRLLGVSRFDMLERLAQPHDWIEHKEDLLNQRPFSRFRCPVCLPGEETRRVESSGTPFFDNNGTFLGYRGIARDTKEELCSKEKLELAGREIRINETVFHHVERIAKIGAWKFDIRTGASQFSDEVARIFGFDPDTELDMEMTLASYTGEGRIALNKAVAHTIKTGEAFDIILPFSTEKQKIRWIRVLGEAEIVTERTVMLFGTVQDVTEERNRQDEMRRLAETDHLTGLANRALFHDMANQAIAGRCSRGNVWRPVSD